MSKKGRIRNRVLACLLAAAMIVGEIPSAALKVLAAEEAQTETYSSAQSEKEDAEAVNQAAPQDDSDTANSENPDTQEKISSDSAKESEAKTESAASEASKSEASDTKASTEASKTEASETKAPDAKASTEAEAIKTDGESQESDSAPAESEEPSTLEDTGSSSLTDIPDGYDWTDIKVTPRVYVAEFSAKSASGFNDPEHRLRMVYTKDETLRDQYLTGKSDISFSDMIINKVLDTAPPEELKVEYDETCQSYVVKFIFSTEYTDVFLEPNTKYYWRLVYLHWDDTLKASHGAFLTDGETSVPFTTLEPMDSQAAITDLKVEEAGYHKAKISWTVTNPNYEKIIERKVQLSADGINYTDTYQSISENTEDGKFYAAIPFEYAENQDKKTAKKARIKLTVSDNGQESVKYSNEIELTPKDISERSFTVTVSKNTAENPNVWTAHVSAEPIYEADGYSDIVLYYRKKGEYNYKSIAANSFVDAAGNSKDKLSKTAELKDLSEDTIYQYYVSSNGLGIYGTSSNPKAFSTGDATVYDETDFPDKAFRDYVKRALNDGNYNYNDITITSANLAKLTKLELPKNGSNYNMISSIKGIELIPNLTSIDFSGHDIFDASPISGLTKLESIKFENNVLETLPDMAGMANLTSANFDKNRIPAEKITADKLPSGFPSKDAWVKATQESQQAGVSCVTAPKYYPAQKDGKKVWPFIAKIENLREDYNKKYTLSLTIGGKTVSVENLSRNSYGMYLIPDIEVGGISPAIGTTYQAAIKMTDNNGRVWLDTVKELTFAEDEGDYSANKTYTSTAAKECNVTINGFPPSAKISDIKSIALNDAGGNKVGEASLSNRTFYPSWIEHPYTDIFKNFYPSSLSGNTLTFPKRQNLSVTMYFFKYPAKGNYSVQITMAGNDTPITLEDAVCVQEGAVLNGIFALSGNDYDQFGEYWYVQLQGSNIDPAKVWPEFYNGDTLITGLISASDVNNDHTYIVYKLKKLNPGTYWQSETSQKYRIKAADNYAVTNNITGDTLTYTLNDNKNDFVIYERYDERNGVYKVKLDSRIAAGTEMAVTVKESGNDSAAATAEGTLAAGGWLSLNFKNSSNAVWVPPYNIDLLFTFSYSGKSFSHTGRRHDFNFASEYNPDGSSYEPLTKEMPVTGKNLEIKLYSKKAEISPVVISRWISRSYVPVINNAAAKKTGKSEGEYPVYSVTWDGSDLEEGGYAIYDGADCLASFEVYESGKFYMNYQSVGKWPQGDTADAIGAEVSFSSKNLLAQYSKNRPDALEYWKSNGYKLEIFDTLKSPITGWNIESANWYGKDSLTLRLKGVPKGYTGYYVRITKNGQPGSLFGEKGTYYDNYYNASKDFGRLHNIGYLAFFRYSNETEQCYAVGANSKDAYPLTVTFIPSGDIDPIKTTLKIDGPTSPKKQPTDTGTEHYFTAADLKAIDKDKTYRLLVADKDGNILSYYNEGYLCEFSEVGSSTPKPVTNYNISAASLSFDLEDAEKTKQLAVTKNGAAYESVAWKTSNSSVAAVGADGKVTAAGVGSAVITADVKEGSTVVVQLSCTVTVTHNTLTGIALSENKYSLRTGETKQLNVYYTPADTTADKTIAWSSSNPAAASVDSNGNVTAAGAGTATITATASNGKTAACEVTVKSVTTKEDAEKAAKELPKLAALTNAVPNLKNITLPSGWSWVNGDIDLKPFAGAEPKSFAAQYAKTADSLPYAMNLPVAVSTVTGAKIKAEKGAILTKAEGDRHTDTLSVEWIQNGTFDMAEYEKKADWNSENKAVASVAKNDDGTAAVTALSSGKTAITLSVKVENAEYTAKYNVTAVDAAAEITVNDITGFTPKDGSYYGEISGEPKDSRLRATVTSGVKLTATSSDTNIIAAGSGTKSTADGVDAYEIPLTVKAAGAADITLTANDAAKTSRTITLYVTDPEPRISEDTVTLNLQRTDGAEFYLYPHDGYTVTGATLAGDDADKFDVAAEARGGSLLVKAAAKNGTAKGTYKKLSVDAKVKNAATAEEKTITGMPLSIKVVDAKPKYKVSQSGKVNLFYTDSRAELNISSDEAVTDVDLEDSAGGTCDFRVEKDAGDGKYYLRAKSRDADVKNNKGTLSITFEGYKPVTQNFTVSAQDKAPKLALSSKGAAFYKNAHTALTDVMIGREKQTLDNAVTVKCGEKGNPEQSVEGFSAELQNGSILVTGPEPGTQAQTVKLTISLQDRNWNKPITLDYTVNMKTGAPVLKLSKATLKLNAALWKEDAAATWAMWKDGAAFNGNISIIGDENIGFSRDASGKIIARLQKEGVQTGSYSFKAAADGAELPLKVTVVDEPISKALTISAKGNIDVLDRNGTYVAVTPALKSINGKVTNAELTGNDAPSFKADFENGKILIRADKDATLVTKYDYKVKLLLTIESEDAKTFEQETSEIKLKLKQGKPKVAITPAGAVFFSGINGTAVLNAAATLPKAEAPEIANMELLNNKTAFGASYSNGRLTITSTKKAAKNKSYSLQFKVTFKGQADNEKPVTVKYSVKVK